jgi:repressor LexA
MERKRRYALNRIKELRRAQGLSLEELGGRMQHDLTASTVAKLENSKMALSADYLVEIAQILGVTPTQLLFEGASDVRMVPVIGAVEAGRWGEAIRSSERLIAVPGHIRGTKLFVLEPQGDSMDKYVQHGGFIVVDPDRRELLDGKLYVVQNAEHETTFKKFTSRPLQLVPCSHNPAHSPIDLGSEPFTVIGQVVFVGFEP